MSRVVADAFEGALEPARRLVEQRVLQVAWPPHLPAPAHDGQGQAVLDDIVDGLALHHDARHPHLVRLLRDDVVPGAKYLRGVWVLLRGLEQSARLALAQVDDLPEPGVEQAALVVSEPMQRGQRQEAQDVGVPARGGREPDGKPARVAHRDDAPVLVAGPEQNVAGAYVSDLGTLGLGRPGLPRVAEGWPADARSCSGRHPSLPR